MKTIFITGGATGIGRKCVELYVARGWNVAFMDINAGEAAGVADSLPGDRVLFVRGDTRDAEDCRTAVRRACGRFGALDAVFANAGIHQNDTLLTVSPEDLHRIVDINVFGTVNTLQAAVPALIDRGGGAVVINCSDQWHIGKADNFAYGLTKGALGQIVRSLSIDLAPYGIRVNAVCPSTIDTPVLHRALRRSAERTGIPYGQLLEEECALFAPGRVGRPEEVAQMVWFLTDEATAFCTGSHYNIDGGLTAR